MNQPGRLNHARWLTCANRVLRLYVSTPNPNDKLIFIVTYLLKVYVPQWFSIRKQKSICEGSRHLFKTITFTRYLAPHYLYIVNNSISRNAFFAMHENILLSMMTDASHDVRMIALEKILAAREEAYNNIVPKINRKLPTINFAATQYHETIDWSTSPYTSPLVLKNISNQVLIIRLSSEEVFEDWDFCKYPCHTVAVERLVKLVTKASTQVCGQKNRNDFIEAILLSRKSLQHFDTKKEFPTTKTI